MQRFFLTSSDRLRDNLVIVANFEIFHQITKVLRAKIGEQFIFLPNDGREILSELTMIDDSSLKFKIVRISEPATEPPIKMTLAQSVLKNLDRFEFALQKAVELGYTDIQPLITERTERVPKNKSNRWQKIIKEAAEQSGRTKIPILHQEVNFSDLPNSPTLIIPHTTVKYRENTLEKLLLDNRPSEVIVAIGPEGGFTEQEINSKDMSVRIGLGARILRSETAGLVVATLINSVLEKYD
jgi:16S rRNA (uracil1498-N3)-methyltransferase